MRLISRLSSLFRNLVRRDRVERDLDDELTAYVDALTEQKRREGVPSEAARRAALVEVGGVQQVREQVRAVRIGASLGAAQHQFRCAIRTTVRRPALSALLVITTGLGIGAATAVFSVVDAAILRRPEFRNPGELVELWTVDPEGRVFPRLDAERASAWTNQPVLFAKIEQYTLKTVLLGGVDEPEEIRAAAVSPGMFAMLGIGPAKGRAFGPADTLAAAPPVAVASEAFWRRHGFDSIPPAARRIRLDERDYTVIGAMAASFRFPIAGASIWLPLRRDARDPTPAVNYVARVRPPASERAVRQRFDAVTKRLTSASPRTDGWGVTPHFLSAPTIDGAERLALWVLAGAVLCMLSVACVNAANLLLVSGSTRQREIGVRLALGATRGRLVADLLVENGVLGCVAAVTGVAIAHLGVGVIIQVAPTGLVDLTNGPVGVDGRVLEFAVITTLLTWAACSIAPAIQAFKTRESLAWQARGASASRGSRRVRSLLVIAELAISVVLMSGAALFARSLTRLLAVNPGFDIEHVLFADLGMSAAARQAPDQRAAMLEAIAREVRAVPGVRAVSFATGLPPNAPTSPSPTIESESGAGAMRGADAAFSEVDTAFFSSLGVPILRGRSFNGEDVVASSAVVVINPALAHALWPSQDPIGRRLRLAPGEPWRTVVGIAGDLKLVGPDDRSSPYAIYYPRPIVGRATRIVSMAIRTSGNPHTMVTAVKNAIHRASPAQPVSRLAPAGVAFAESTQEPRFIGALVACFALVAVLLAASGVYGVFSYAVAQRTREIGIRMALGARQADVAGALLKEGLLLAIAGLGIGLAGVAACSRAIASLLFGIGPADPVTLVAVVVVLTAVAISATLVPTLRASRISPLVAISLD